MNAIHFVTELTDRDFFFDLMKYDIAVIGAGIIGAACAFRFSLEGWRVIVIEARGIAGGITSGGMGHIVVLDDCDAQFDLTRYSQALWLEMAPQLPVGAEFTQCGTIWIAADADEFDEAKKKHAVYQKHGIDSVILDEHELLKLEPHLRPGLSGGLLVPEDSVVYQLSACAYFMEKAAESGAVIKTGVGVEIISEAGLTLQNGETILADKIVNAAGLSAARLTPSLRIIPRKGHLLITERYPGFASHQLVELGYLKSAHSTNEDSVAFNIQPRPNGQVLIGSSRQFGVTDAAIDFLTLSKMIARATKFMPGISDLSGIRAWTGFRPATPDNLPYIGKCPDFDNVYLAAGHEGFGITTCLGTAELLTDEFLGRGSAIRREPYSPARFRLSERKLD